MQTEKLLATVMGLVALGCTTTYAPLPPAHDAGPRDAFVCPECDTGPIFVHPDAGHDAGPPVDANVDSGPVTFDAGTTPIDAGGPTFAIVVDGLLTDPAWVDMTPLIATITPLDPFGGDHLDQLFYFRDAENLYIAFAGELAAGDRIVFYVDLGTTFSDVSLMGTGLGDTTGAVDATLSIPMFGTAEFAPEIGWGTASMPHTASAGDDTIGWRRLSSVGAFPLITSRTRSQCTAMACETAIALASIGATSSSPINLAVRLGRPGVGWSNQTFPATSSGTPEFIDFSIAVPAGPSP